MNCGILLSSNICWLQEAGAVVLVVLGRRQQPFQHMTALKSFCRLHLSTKHLNGVGRVMHSFKKGDTFVKWVKTCSGQVQTIFRHCGLSPQVCAAVWESQPICKCKFISLYFMAGLFSSAQSNQPTANCSLQPDVGMFFCKSWLFKLIINFFDVHY